MRLIRYDEARPSKGQRRAFDCGEEPLNRWLVTQARQSMASRDAVTYLLMDGTVIAGYFCLSAGQVTREAMPTPLARAAPDPIPVVRMGRFAIDRHYQRQGWGADLLREALLGARGAAQLIGARALLVDALHEQAAAFYRRFGFVPSPIHRSQLMIGIDVIAASAGFGVTTSPRTGLPVTSVGHEVTSEDVRSLDDEE